MRISDLSSDVCSSDLRPLLLFAPTGSDPRLVETLSLIEASRCDFVSRDMVTGLVVTDGTSTLDGHVLSADQSRGLASQYAIGENAFSVLLIGKDGRSEERRVGKEGVGTCRSRW